MESADSKRGGCTSEAGSLRDGGVFWYYNDIKTSKVHERVALWQGFENLLAQGAR